MMSRHDIDGIFWKEDSVPPPIIRPLAPIPDTGWKPPAEFPRLDAASMICIDCETKDTDLLTKGPGCRRGAHIVGLAVGVPDGGRWYFPMRHEVGAEQNLDPAVVMRWAKDQLCRKKQTKIGANLLYDLDMLAVEDVHVVGPLIDVQIAEPLIDENALSYSLDALSRKHLGEGKVDDVLYRWAQASYGGKEGRAQAANIYRCPPSLVGPYAEGDVDRPLRIWEKQKGIISLEGLSDVFSVESRLIPLLLAMRRRGVRVDVAVAERAYEMLSGKIALAEKSLGGIDIYSGADIARYCKREGIEYLRTEAGNPSFTASWLERHSSPAMQMISECRKYYKSRDTFIKGYLLDSHIDGRIHCQFNQLRSDDSGAVSGRFSSSLPNLQNIPARDPEVGPMIRRMFVPDEGETWAKFDWSQIEFRLLCHYGRGSGADVARGMYRDDPTTDFHTMVSTLTGVPRREAKNINFGLAYGMGEKLLAAHLGRTLEEVKPLFDTYHSRLPFVRHTAQEISRVAERRGYIKTHLGRRRRFDLWEPAGWGKNDEGLLPYELAVAKWGSVRRAMAHKATNSLMQGTAADIMKLAMVQMWEASVCDPGALGAMLMTVHDEADFSVPAGREDVLAEVKHIMETCVKLKVPIIAEMETGPSWGELT